MLVAGPNPPLRGPPLRGVHLRATGVALPFALRPCGVVNTSRGRPSSRTPHRSRTSIPPRPARRSEEHTSELQSLMRISYAVFCLKKKNRENNIEIHNKIQHHTKSNEVLQKMKQH